MNAHLDERDLKILVVRKRALRRKKAIKSGDFVVFTDGTTRRVSHVWKDSKNRPEFIQTSDGGDMSFYLGEGYMSFSGGLHPSLPASLFTKTDEFRDGYCWFFHHDYATAHNGVHATVPCPVWTCNSQPN